MKLDGKTALITGAGSGIGRGVALALAAEGARVAICGRRLHKLDETAAEIKAVTEKNALVIQADISITEEVKKVLTAVMAEFGRLDILINNAGIFDQAPLHETSDSAWQQVMQTNLFGPFALMREALPQMRAQKSGHIINISSESGIEYYEGDTVYGLSKHALNDLEKFAQKENQEYNIRINTICPGMVVTEMSENSAGLDHSKCLFPEDIADLVLWLVTRRQNIKIGTPILIQTMLNPWE